MQTQEWYSIDSILWSTQYTNAQYNIIRCTINNASSSGRRQLSSCIHCFFCSTPLQPSYDALCAIIHEYFWTFFYIKYTSMYDINIACLNFLAFYTKYHCNLHDTLRVITFMIFCFLQNVRIPCNHHWCIACYNSLTYYAHYQIITAAMIWCIDALLAKIFIFIASTASTWCIATALLSSNLIKSDIIQYFDIIDNLI